MHRIDAAGNVAGLFTDGNPATASAATVVDASWLNAVQEEIVAVVAAAGIGLNPSANNQMAQAIAALIATAMGAIGAATETTSGQVELATNAETITGTDTVRATHPAGVKAAIQAAISALVNAAPAALDTLNELAASLGNDASFAATVTAALAAKAPLASPALTGAPTAPTPTAGSNNTVVATTAFVAQAIAAFVAQASTAEISAESAVAKYISPDRLANSKRVAKALVNFNGENTVSIRSAMNVSSITDNGVGQFYINFTSALASADYCPMVSNSAQSANGYGGTYATLIFNSTASPNVAAPNTTGFGVLFTHNGSIDLDPTYACIAVF